jgi:TM2 domain-containing membrane protein YozV
MISSRKFIVKEREIFRNFPEPNRIFKRIVMRRLKNFTMREPFIAGLLSFLIPGLGQIYNGRILVGIIWLLLTGVSWIGSAGTLGWIVHIIAAWCAYSYAKDNPVR